MIPIILPKRRTKVRTGRVFNKLIAYVEGVAEHETLHAVSQTQKFDNILNYTTNRQNERANQDKCIAVRCHGVTDLSSAAIEMNAVAARNTRCEDPAFHFVLTWPEHESATPEDIFDAGEHAIRSLGLAEHQYVLAIHVNTDNVHCHAAVNRIHPDTFKSRNIEWAHKTIHHAARQSELKHGWTHDNGIYIVETDGQGNKSIILNPDHATKRRISQKTHESKSRVPTWHDPDGLRSWIRTKVSKALKQALPTLTSWQTLHSWLADYSITLSDSGGGGMRLHAASAVTKEVIDLPASKALRILKRAELEKRWGAFTQPLLRVSGFPTGSYRNVSDTVEKQADTMDRIAIDSDGRSKLSLKELEREERRHHRAATRADLRRRFAQYRRFVSEGDVDYFKRRSELRSELAQSIKTIKIEANALCQASRRTWPAPVRGSLLRIAAIDFEATRRRLEAEAIFQTKMQSVRTSRLPPLAWREWLHEQANLGDQAAVSALRGIVYQARRDAKRKGRSVSVPNERLAQTHESYARHFHKLMARLLEEERNETAIRSTSLDAMRPFEADAILVRYTGMRWYVTGNGNIQYSDEAGKHLFTDRGNRVTFDRILVIDEDIQLALAHARQKFGSRLTLTGDDPIFTARMACLADDMGLLVLNPDMQEVIANHRHKRLTQSAKLQRPPITEINLETSGHTMWPNDGSRESPQASALHAPDRYERLRVMVLAIDPRATFVIPDASDSLATYRGPVAAAFPSEANTLGFAQHIGRGVYALHLGSPPTHHNDASIDVRYRDGVAVAIASGVSKGTGGRAK